MSRRRWKKGGRKLNDEDADLGFVAPPLDDYGEDILPDESVVTFADGSEGADDGKTAQPSSMFADEKNQSNPDSLSWWGLAMTLFVVLTIAFLSVMKPAFYEKLRARFYGRPLVVNVYRNGALPDDPPLYQAHVHTSDVFTVSDIKTALLEEDLLAGGMVTSAHAWAVRLYAENGMEVRRAVDLHQFALGSEEYAYPTSAVYAVLEPDQFVLPALPASASVVDIVRRTSAGDAAHGLGLVRSGRYEQCFVGTFRRMAVGYTPSVLRTVAAGGNSGPLMEWVLMHGGTAIGNAADATDDAILPAEHSLLSQLSLDAWATAVPQNATVVRRLGRHYGVMVDEHCLSHGSAASCVTPLPKLTEVGFIRRAGWRNRRDWEGAGDFQHTPQQADQGAEPGEREFGDEEEEGEQQGNNRRRRAPPALFNPLFFKGLVPPAREAAVAERRGTSSDSAAAGGGAETETVFRHRFSTVLHLQRYFSMLTGAPLGMQAAPLLVRVPACDAGAWVVADGDDVQNSPMVSAALSLGFYSHAQISDTYIPLQISFDGQGVQQPVVPEGCAGAGYTEMSRDAQQRVVASVKTWRNLQGPYTPLTTVAHTSPARFNNKRSPIHGVVWYGARDASVCHSGPEDATVLALLMRLYAAPSDETQDAAV